MKTQIIYCPQCGEPCGKYYPSTGPTVHSGGEIEFSEGIGENFIADGNWHCSQDCVDKTRTSRPAG